MQKYEQQLILKLSENKARHVLMHQAFAADHPDTKAKK
jgi:hypothetical protein